MNLADSIIPGFTPSVPSTLRDPTSAILGWTAGGGLTLAVLGALAGWGMVSIGHHSERASLASRGKQAIIWSLISGMGIGVTSGLIMTFYNLTQSG